MSELYSHIISQMHTFSRQERAELAYAFVRSLEPEVEDGVEEAWKEELERRVAEIRSGKAIGKPAAALFAEFAGTRNENGCLSS